MTRRIGAAASGLAALLLLFAPGTTRAQDVMTPELLWKLKRVSAPAVSPDGRHLVYGVTEYDVAANTGDTDLFLVDVDGGEPVRLTSMKGSEHSAAWRPDGQWIGFLSGKGGSTQLWEVRPNGKKVRQVTDVEGGIANFEYSPDGTHISFTSDVKLDKTIHDLYPDLPEADARIMDGLMYRHWDSWHDYAYSHLFVAPYKDGWVGEAMDLMEGERFDTPLSPFGGVEQIAWSPDGRTIAYTSKKLVGTEYAVSTNSDIYIVDIDSGDTRNFTEGMMGYDVGPVFSPDGNRIAWLSMERDGYESDRNRLFVHDFRTGQRAELTAAYDDDAHSPVWTSGGEVIYFTSDSRGTVQIFAVPADGGDVRRVTDGVFDYVSLAVAETDEAVVLVGSRRSMSSPNEIYRIDPGSGEAEQITFANRDILAGIEMGRVEKRMIEATDGQQILTWVIYPPDFDPARRYPALLYAQGGPQGTVSQFFSYRWNFQLMAANGYIVVAPNRRGVPSFGQAWKEEISGDWGGQAMQDLLSAIDAVAAEPYVDESRLGAVGASYGGYTVYWLAGNHEGRFKTFVAHAGVFNLESMYGATEELFFVNFDLGGAYWDRPDSYERFSPHRFVQNWDTPILVIHGQKDFRVPVTEGMQAFTAAQLKGVESRFLYFPEEGHWVLTPQDGLLWHRVFFDWLGRYLKPVS
jgi:dipeptidyl aminopeptidase/acylaminoacyl peptidase